MSAGNILQRFKLFDDLSGEQDGGVSSPVIGASEKESLVESISKASTSRQEVVYAIMKHQWIKENPKFDPRNIPCGGKVNKTTKYPTFHIEKLSPTCIRMLMSYFESAYAEDSGKGTAMDICEEGTASSSPT